MKRVVHVLRQMNPGGIECWLDRLIRQWPLNRRPEFHIILESQDSGSLAPGLEAAGVRFHFCPPPSQTLPMWLRFRQILKQLGSVDVVHCHNHRAAFFYLSAAAAEKVPIRIAHSHADFQVRDSAASAARRAYCAFSKFALDAVANRKIAVSRAAADDLFGPDTRSVDISPCGTDFDPLLQAERTSDPSCFTLVHVGRMVPEKNHEFLLRILKALLPIEPRAQLKLIGDGPLCCHIKQRVSSLGLERHVEFLGNRNDIPELLATGDVFVFPSLSEGLGLAAIEAQSVGLPVLLASHLPKELDLIPGLCHRLALQLPVEAWVNSLLEIKSLPYVSKITRRAHLEASGFSIHANIQFLEQVYAS